MVPESSTHDSRSYARAARLAEYVVRDTAQRIEAAIHALGDPNLVRAKLDASRIKSQRSVARKSRERGWTFAEAIAQASDFVGFRLVCHNLQDARRSADLLEDSLRAAGREVGRQDYAANPKPSGYRAIHLMFRMRVRLGDDEAEFGCEIQIRSLLENAWAELSRAEIYAEDVPPPIERQMTALSSQLARADATAERIRNRLARPRRGHRSPPGQPLSASAIAFIFREVFNEDPPDYLVRVVLRETAGTSIRTDGLHQLLLDVKFVDRLKRSYADEAGFDAEPDRIFLWAVYAMTDGREAAVRRAAGEARMEWEEIRSIAQRELLPDADELDRTLRSVEYADKDDDDSANHIAGWSSVLGASSNCAFCGTAMVDPNRFAAAAVKYYGESGKRGAALRRRFSAAAESAALETGSLDRPGVCGHCSHMLSED